MKISRKYGFEAAHKLTKVAPDHKCARLHGHSFKVKVSVRRKAAMGAALDSRGMVCDFDEIDRAWAPIYKLVDHNYLNDVLDNPTSENIAHFIYDRLVTSDLWPAAIELVRVDVRETKRSCARYP